MFRYFLVLAGAQALLGSNLLLDTFESGGLSNTLWANNSSGIVVDNPQVDANNLSSKVLQFTGTRSGGDLYSNFLNYAADPEFATFGSELFLSFDVLWTSPTTNDYIGTDHTTSGFTGGEEWLYSTLNSGTHGGIQPLNTWTHVGFYFTPTDPGNDGTIVIKLEANSSPATGAYFDNISLAAVPEPSTLGLLALGLGGFAVRIRRQRG